MRHLRLVFPVLWMLAALPAQAQTAPATPANSQPAAEQVIQPQVQRREIKRPEYPSNDFSITAFGGFYSVENFGNASVSGLRAGYHITEDFFAEASWGRTTISDEAYRVGRPGGILPQPSAPMTYYNVALGYNLLTGEAFFGRNLAKATQGYVVVGAGSTKYAGQTWQTFTTGFGLRLIVKNWFALQADVRDHVFSNDLLGTRKSTHNPEVTAGLTLYF
jgi:outer membrane beta-barrel protein